MGFPSAVGVFLFPTLVSYMNDQSETSMP